MKILINTPNIHGLGGVANHYLGLKPYWTENVRYLSLGSKRWRTVLTPLTVIRYAWRLLTFRPDVVLLNPSLGKGALTRDFFYLRLAKAFGRKVAVFIHGFSWDYARTARWPWIARHLNRADGVIVLAQAFKDELQRRGVTAPVFLSTTKVADSLVEGFDADRRTGRVNNLLFLSRIERAKGVYETADTFALLKQTYKDLTLTFVGDGSELAALKAYVRAKGIAGIRFTGGLSGGALRHEYEIADFFCCSSHGEGMPTVVLEAMAFGLPVLTRAVGGVCDFFEDGRMGRITTSTDPAEFARLVKPFIDDADLTRRVSLYNARYAREHFMASVVARQMENILSNLS